MLDDLYFDVCSLLPFPFFNVCCDETWGLGDGPSKELAAKIGVATANIHHFVRDGAKHGALGMLNTAWEDDGEALNAPKWHGQAWGTECAWNASVTDSQQFNRRIGGVLFGEPGDHFGRASVGQSSVLEIVRPAIGHFEACKKQASVTADLLDYFLFGARRIELIGQRMLDGLEAAELYTQAFETSSDEALPLLARALALVQKNRDAHEALGRQFRQLWLRESKPYALDWTMKRYESVVSSYDDLAGRLAVVRRKAEAGKPLPRPEDLGLALPDQFSRRTRPHQIMPTPLMPDATWAEPAATHRLGLSVKAGSAARFDLPVELDVQLPAGFGTRKGPANCGRHEAGLGDVPNLLNQRPVWRSDISRVGGTAQRPFPTE